MTIDLKPWRTERLGLAKASPQYQSLDTILRRIVDYMVRAHDNPVDGMFISQTKLAKRFKVSRQTMNEYMGLIVAAGVFTCQKRKRRRGTRGGQTTNLYRLHPLVLNPTPDTTADISPDLTPDSRSSTSTLKLQQIEAPKGHIEALHVEDVGERGLSAFEGLPAVRALSAHSQDVEHNVNLHVEDEPRPPPGVRPEQFAGWIIAAGAPPDDALRNSLRYVKPDDWETELRVHAAALQAAVEIENEGLIPMSVDTTLKRASHERQMNVELERSNRPVNRPSTAWFPPPRADCPGRRDADPR